MKLRELLDEMKRVQIEKGTSMPFICGGTPRDKMLGRLDNISDLDVTTGDKTVDYLSQEFAESLKKKYNITRKAMEDGHSTIFVGNLKIDFSSNYVVPGIDKILQSRGIAEPTPLQQEMYSRDFTCNSLLLSLDLTKIYDPTRQGVQDIKSKKIKTCLEPEITLTHSRNRVVRSIYLSSKLGFEIDQSIIDFVRNHPDTIKIGTDKALNEKLNEAFTRDPKRAAANLSKMNVWNYVPITEIMYPYYKGTIRAQ